MTLASTAASIAHFPRVGALKRPKLLSRAARAGLRLYDRDRDLARILPGDGLKKRGAEVLGRLRAMEAECEEARRSGATGYSISRHVELLTALVAEAACIRNRRAA